MDPLSNDFLIWFTGFYEGEGTVSNDKSNNNRLRLSVSQNDNTPLKLIQQRWGGSIRVIKKKSCMSDKICVGNEWRVSHKKALEIITEIRPYMLIPYKINQIEKVLENAKKGYAGSYTCHFCSLVYKNPAGRRRHEKKEHIEKGKLFECNICFNTYKSRDSMKRHQKINHSTTKC